MSFLTGTNTELIYASTAAGATVSGSAVETVMNTTAAMGVQAHLPPDFWLPNNTQVGRGIRIVARGVYGTTATTSTLGIYVRGGSAQSTAGALLVGSSTATAPTTTVSMTAQYWELQADLILTAIAGAGANSTLRGVGSLTLGGGTAAATVWPVWGGGVSPGTIATFDTSITEYLNVDAVWGTSNTNNTITLDSLLVFGLN